MLIYFKFLQLITEQNDNILEPNQKYQNEFSSTYWEKLDT